jgi:hemolysin D
MLFEVSPQGTYSYCLGSIIVRKLGRSGGLPSLSLFADRQQDKAATRPPNWSVSLQSALDQPPAALPRYLLLGGMCFSLCFGIWAYRGTIEEIGQARGQLVPQGDVYKIHPVESGKITKLLVKAGQRVKAGQTLAELDAQIPTGEVERLQQTLAADQAQLSQMEGLIARSRLEAEQQGQMLSAEAQGQVSAIAQGETKVKTTREVLTKLQADAAAQQTRLEKLKLLASQGAIAQEQLFEVEQTLRDRQLGITQNQGQLAQASAEISQLEAGLTQKQADARRLYLAAQQKTQQLEVAMMQLTAKIAETRTLLTTAGTKLNQRFLTTPIEGTVSSLTVHNVGEVVEPGQTIAEVTALKTPLILRVLLPNQEAGFVTVGMPVQVKLDAYPYQDYGTISGKVLTISPDAKPQESLGLVYQVEVGLDRDSITANQRQISFKAGQTATAEIVIRKRRIMDVLLDPIRQFQKGGIAL